jgi:hypothetical protein
MRYIFWTGGLLIAITIFVFLVSQFADTSFQKKSNEISNNILNKSKLDNIGNISEDDLDNLPEPVQRWLRYSNVVGKDKIKTVRLKQTGLMRTKPEQKGMKTEAVQYFNTEEPSFIWTAQVNMAPLLYFAGRDTYLNGKGHMSIKVLSLFPVVDGIGEEINQGTLTRYLGEIIWFPTAALSQYITWKEIDYYNAKATMSYKGTTASANFEFDEEGKLVEYSCERYYSGDDGYRLEKYHAPVWDYQEFSGVKIPTKAKAIWRLDSGDYEYYEMKITDLEYNINETY